jgi:hypothetical protein
VHVGKPVSVEYRVPALAAKTPPRVVKVFPTAGVLPANVLRFYIYFDRSMRGGKDIFKHINIVDDKGKIVEDPWLLDEIWDEENNCLIIYIQPGRIKWGVELRELLGPVFFEKRAYSLVVRGDVADLDGNKLGTDFVKKFRTSPEDRVRIDLRRWQVSPPQAGTSERLTVGLGKSIDHRGLEKALSVVDANGKRLEGAVAIGKDENTWHFTRRGTWGKGDYFLHIDGKLEDVAGNTPLRPFDLDLKAPKLPPQDLRLKFSVNGD